MFLSFLLDQFHLEAGEVFVSMYILQSHNCTSSNKNAYQKYVTTRL